MRPARSRRVQAQRKFAQGAYVPPNVVAVAATDNRRDAAQDPRNVTINNVTATGLLDVVSLQSATSSSDKNGHSHLTSQPVVILERLRGGIPANDVPPPSQCEPKPRHLENPHERRPPKLQTIKKKKDKPNHPMLLRSRRLSKLELNNVVAESCAPLRKTASKPKKNSSDEDEPLIFQKTRLKQKAKQLSTSKQTAARDSAPMKRVLQKSISNKFSPKQTADVAPEFTVPDFLSTVIEEDLTVETVVQDCKADMVTPDDSDIVMQDVSNVPMVLDNEEESLPFVGILDDVLAPLDAVFAEEHISVSELDELVNLHDVPMVNDDDPEVPDDVSVVLHDVPMMNNDLPMVNDDVPNVPDEVPVILHDVPMVSNNVLEDTGDPDVPLIKSAMMIEDDVMVHKNIPRSTDYPITTLRIASPEYNSSSKENDAICTDHLGSDADEPFVEEILQNTTDNLGQNVQFEVSTTCVAAEWRSDQDVINASQELLDSRCKVCKPCIRIEKLMKVSTLLKSQIELTSIGQENMVAVLESEPTEREGETEDVEIDNEDADSTNNDQDHLYLLLPKHSSVMLKLGTSMVHGKEVLGVRLMPRDHSLKNKQEFSLEEREHLLDQLIETLTIGRDVDSMERNENTELPNVNTEGRSDNLVERIEITELPNVNTEGRSDNLKEHNDIPKSRSISISSDSTVEMSDATTHDQRAPIRLTAETRKRNRLAVKKKLAEAELMHDRIREEKEREIARLEEEKRQEISRITAENNIFVAEMSRFHERFTQMEKEKQRDFARLKVEIRAEVISKIEANRRMCAEVDGMAADLAKEKDAKKMYPEELSDLDAPGTSSSMLTTNGGLLVDAPVYHPSEEDFRDPLLYYEKIWPEAVRYGICKVVPPPGWKPSFRVHDEMRFDVTNQYISRLFNRWGPAARELCAIKLSLAQQKVNFTRAPLLDGVEVNLPKLYHLVQRHGGLETVYNKKRWSKVAEDMKFNKGPNTERKLDQIYVKYLLPYDTLSHQERQDIMRKVEIAWNRKNQKLLDRAVNPLNRQKRLLGLMDSSDDETEDEDTVAAVNEAEDCIIKGAVMNRAKFKKIATMTYENTFGQSSEAADPPELIKIEEYYWRLVTLGTEHMCVHTAAIDTGEEGYGFIKNKLDSYGRHPWNPKMVSQNRRNVLQYLGPVLGVTVPTLLLGMLFSTSCWHKDPHAVSWLEYQLLGPERIWYGIPAHQADNFRKAVETLCPTSCQNKGLWLPSDITMIPPNLLREHNVTLSRVTQRDSEYIMAFPNAYTCCISTGYTESESIYFAPPSWLENLWTVFKEARESCEPTMFAMEHLLYNIGKDPKADLTILKIAQPLYDKMLREEVTNRQMLQERGLPFNQDLLSANTSRRKNKATPFNPRGQDECEYCRATLYLSKVKGLTGRNTVLCLEHALKLLDTEKYKDRDVKQLQVLVHVSVKELNTVHDDMKRRLNMSTA